MKLEMFLYIVLCKDTKERAICAVL